MSSFIQHGFQGSFILSLIPKLFYPTIIPITFTIGFVSGIAPDLVEFIGRVFFNVNLKQLTHEGTINKYFRWNPAWQLHILTDKYFHSLEDDNWVKQLNEWIGWLIIDPLIIKFLFF
ncbi:MAG: hypothetical protein N2321_04430 [Melioribacteraceae bacterium]|nr:hypothetical protein [Melioribacteraceae bacterium]